MRFQDHTPARAQLHKRAALMIERRRSAAAVAAVGAVAAAGYSN